MDGMTLAYVPAGEFPMGLVFTKADGLSQDETPQHTVYVDAFWMDRTEVSNAQFAKFVAAIGYQTDAEREGGSYIWDYKQGGSPYLEGANWQHPRGPQTDLTGQDNYPVVQISWNDAAAYCAWAGRHLPTEAEWEKAARSTDGRMFSWGNETPRGDQANFRDKNVPKYGGNENIDDGYLLLAPVDAYPAGRSPYGVLNMAGNASEWIADYYREDYYAQSPFRNPTGPDLPATCGYSHVLRGGDWTTGCFDTFVYHCDVRATYRWADSAFGRNDSYGFRCAVSTAP
jgi:eukaryotic-like serine/threonine-protein kinase